MLLGFYCTKMFNNTTNLRIQISKERQRETGSIPTVDPQEASVLGKPLDTQVGRRLHSVALLHYIALLHF